MSEEIINNLKNLIESIKINNGEDLDIYIDQNGYQYIGIIINSYINLNIPNRIDIYDELEEFYKFDIDIYESDYNDIWLCFNIDFFDTGYINLGDQEVELQDGNIIYYPENRGITYIRQDDIYYNTFCQSTNGNIIKRNLGDIVECSSSIAQIYNAYKEITKTHIKVLNEIYGNDIVEFLEVEKI